MAASMADAQAVGRLSLERPKYSGAMAEQWLSGTHSSSDTDASGSAGTVPGPHGDHSSLRVSLTLLAESVRAAGGGPVADVGPGPGTVAPHLHDLGVEVLGVDLAPELITSTRGDQPSLRSEGSTMTGPELADASVAGLVALWSVALVPDHAGPGVFEEFRRVLRPGGPLLVGVHFGDELRRPWEG